MTVTITIVDTGTANLASLRASFARLGASSVVTSSAEEVAVAALVVLPGVGSFEAGMSRLRSCGLVDVLRDRVTARRPTAGICLGMQLMAEWSEESEGVEGLGVIGGTVRRFPTGVLAPQMGWNRVEPAATEEVLGVEAGYAYFANSYRLMEPPVGWGVAMTDHGGAFISAAWSGPVLLCQFHPELSGSWGQSLLQRWIEVSREAASC